MSATQFTAGLDYDYFQNKDYRFSTGETGSGVNLQGSNTQPLMSALGQKQTSRHLQPMSALPPKADIDRAPNYTCAKMARGSFRRFCDLRYRNKIRRRETEMRLRAVLQMGAKQCGGESNDL
jgi:hypothetical protein